MNPPLLLQLFLVLVLRRQRVLHLPEPVVVHLGCVHVAPHQIAPECLPQSDGKVDSRIGMLGVIHRDIDCLIHR